MEAATFFIQLAGILIAARIAAEIAVRFRAPWVIVGGCRGSLGPEF